MRTEGWEQIKWSGREGIRLFAAGYEAVVVPSLGANAISLKATIGDHTLDILRTPPDDQALLQDAYAYGVPVLFPANRVSGGEYSWDGVTYRFPKNYPNDVHIHGVLHGRSWPVYQMGAEEGRAWIRLTLDTDQDQKLRTHFPVPMAIHLEISVSGAGLTHRFTVENRSARKAIPVGLAYHTAFRVHFCGNSDVKLHVPLAGRCADDPVDRLPNGETEPLDAFEAAIAAKGGGDPLAKVVDRLYTGQPNMPEAILRDSESGCEVVYHAGPENQYWILWNKTATEGFIAVEPQTWLSNAMNRPIPKEDGAIFVAPGKSWSGECSIFARPVKEQ